MPPWADTLPDRFLQHAAKQAAITKWDGIWDPTQYVSESTV